MQDKSQEQKWLAEDLGPRQFKRFQKALRALRAERNTHTRITGVVGGEETRYGVFAPFGGGPVNEAAVAAYDAVGERFGWAVSKKTLKQVEAAVAEAIETAQAGRPVVDERITAEERAERQAAAEARDAEWRERSERIKANHDALRAKAPKGAAAVILAELDEDESDSQTDYFAHRTGRVVAIGWRFGKREDFKQLRAAAASFPETAHLGPDAPDEVEHRDNFAMGSGNYLKDGYTHSSGWRVRSSSIGGRALPHREIEDALPAAPTEAEPTEGREAGGATVSDSERNPANVEVRFESKPSAEIRAELKAARFRWSPRFQCWYGKRENLPTRYAATATA